VRYKTSKSQLKVPSKGEVCPKYVGNPPKSHHGAATIFMKEIFARKSENLMLILGNFYAKAWFICQGFRNPGSMKYYNIVFARSARKGATKQSS
jgi:hypothetical protein